MGFPKGFDVDATVVSDDVLQSLQEKLNKEFIQIIVRLYDFFQDYDKVNAWLYTKNSMLDGTAPMKLIAAGRGFKVLQFIEANEKANLP